MDMTLDTSGQYCDPWEILDHVRSDTVLSATYGR